MNNRNTPELTVRKHRTFALRESGPPAGSEGTDSVAGLTGRCPSGSPHVSLRVAVIALSPRGEAAPPAREWPDTGALAVALLAASAPTARLREHSPRGLAGSGVTFSPHSRVPVGPGSERERGRGWPRAPGSSRTSRAAASAWISLFPTMRGCRICLRDF